MCSLDDQVGRFFNEHADAIDCQFAHQFSSYGEVEIVGADIVRECILDSIARSRSFVGGYLLYGIDSGESVAYLGESTSNGIVLSQLHERSSAYTPTRVSATPCSAMTPREPTMSDIGIDCVDADLVELCSK